MGTLTIDRVENDNTSPARDINFDPMILSEGIAGSENSLLNVETVDFNY